MAAHPKKYSYTFHYHAGRLAPITVEATSLNRAKEAARAQGASFWWCDECEDENWYLYKSTDPRTGRN